jgi:Chromate transporter
VSPSEDTAGHREPAPPGSATAPALVSLATVLREWGRIGCIGFGGPPTHIKLLRELCVERRKWLDAREFEDAIAACNLLPGPASTQLAIFCAWRVRGRPGALAGGAAFIVPGLIVILALSALFLAGSPPLWVLGAGAGAGAAVPAGAVQAGAGRHLVSHMWGRVVRWSRSGPHRTSQACSPSAWCSVRGRRRQRREHFFRAVWRESSESAPSLRIFTSPRTGPMVRRIRLPLRSVVAVRTPCWIAAGQPDEPVKL